MSRLRRSLSSHRISAALDCVGLHKSEKVLRACRSALNSSSAIDDKVYDRLEAWVNSEAATDPASIASWDLVLRGLLAAQ